MRVIAKVFEVFVGYTQNIEMNNDPLSNLLNLTIT